LNNIRDKLLKCAEIRRFGVGDNRGLNEYYFVMWFEGIFIK